MESIEEEIKILIKIWIIGLTAISFCYNVSSKIPKGFFRFLSVLPVFILLTVLPSSCSSIFTTTQSTMLLSWLAGFKLLLFSFGLGPLSSHPLSGGPVNSLPLFVAIATFPVKVNRRQKSVADKPVVPLNMPVKMFILIILMGYVSDNRVFLDPKILVVLYFWVLYFSVEVSIGFCTESIRYLTGLDLFPPSNEPYLATSLQDFWGRWNLLVHNLLSDAVCKPVRLAAAGVLGDEEAKVVAVMVTFIVSGLMHEILLYNLGGQRTPPTWRMTWHFVVHGVFVVVEKWVKKAAAAGGRWRVPRWILTAYVMGFVMTASYYMLFDSVVKAGVDALIFDEFRYFVDVVKHRIRSLELIPEYGL